MWSEVISRITIHLTVVSASLVVLALVAQASGFGTPFTVLSIGLASAALILGTLTGVRVMNASHDDSALILGMNRIRAAYVAIDPGVADYLMTSWEGGRAGLMGTYTMGLQRSTLSHVLGSTTMFVNVVNALVAGTLGALDHRGGRCEHRPRRRRRRALRPGLPRRVARVRPSHLQGPVGRLIATTCRRSNCTGSPACSPRSSAGSQARSPPAPRRRRPSR